MLWLNSALTVEAHKAASHKGKGWEALTERAIQCVLAREGKSCVILAWGKDAEKRVAGVDHVKHLVLKSVVCLLFPLSPPDVKG